MSVQSSDPFRSRTLLSHDLRTQMGGVLGALFLIEESNPTPEVRGHLDRARVSAEMLRELLDLFLDPAGAAIWQAADPAAGLGADTAWLVAGAARQGPETGAESGPASGPVSGSVLTSLPDQIRALHTRWHDEARAKGIDLIVETPPDMPRDLRIHPAVFNRIMNNVLSNAVKFTDTGSVALTCHNGDDGGLTLSVRDSGPGFCDAAQARLFDLGGRPENATKEGSGMGLYIARQLTEHVGAAIRARNLDNGAMLEVDFPGSLVVRAAREHETLDQPHIQTPDQTLAQTPANSVARPPLPDLSALKILVAEDNVTNQLVVTSMLGSMGARLDVASDGVEALRLFQSGGYDIALLDIEMPRKSGLEVIREIRARPDSLSETPLLALTAYVLPEHRERILGAGANAIIAKPLGSIAAFGETILRHARPGRAAPLGQAPAPAAPGPDLPVIDRTAVDQLESLIGADAMRELLERVVADLASVDAQLAEGQAQDDRGALRSAAHILISVAGAVGARALQEQATALNTAAKTGSWSTLGALSGDCRSGIARLQVQVAQERARLG